MRLIRKILDAIWYVLTAITERSDRVPRKKIEEIEEQMEFWHAEESRLLECLRESCSKMDSEAYHRYEGQYRVVCHRCRQEVTEKLDAIK